jgi:hypothetical protein
MLKERLKATLKRVKKTLCMALPGGKKKTKVITVGGNNADIDINKYNSFNGAMQDTSPRLKNGGTIRLQPGNYPIESILPTLKGIIISGNTKEEGHTNERNGQD